MSEISGHFDQTAPSYDFFKRRNWYYYLNLKRLARKFIPKGGTVLEIGAATGDILFSLEPSKGVGIDISPKMIELARQKYKDRPNLEFYSLSADRLDQSLSFDYIVLVDVVEHVENLPELAGQIRKASSPGTTIFVSMANPLWEPVLLLLEKLNMKMPEGKHNRMPAGDIIKIFRDNGLGLDTHGFYLILPAYIPLISEPLNRIFSKIPLFKRLCLIEYLVFRPF